MQVSMLSVFPSFLDIEKAAHSDVYNLSLGMSTHPETAVWSIIVYITSHLLIYSYFVMKAFDIRCTLSQALKCTGQCP